MATNPYITLTNSNSSLSKKFRVLMGSLQPVLNRAQNRRRTLTGKSDNQLGAEFAGWTMTLRVKAASDLSGYGLLSDLVTLFSYNNPAATPSPVITLIDHLGVSHTVEFTNQLSEENLTPYLDGNDAAYLIQVSFEDTL